MAEVEIRRSTRRRRTVRAYREGDKTIVLVPAHLTRAQEAEHVRDLVARLDRREQRQVRSDDDLVERARQLSAQWLDGRAQPRSVRWVTNQSSRWGSCTSVDASIRLSHRLQGMPEHVVDYVLLHELAHLIEANHSRRFWALLSDYPHLERAKGFLEGVAWQRR
jgi:predicted metal-dependent hydrolase